MRSGKVQGKIPYHVGRKLLEKFPALTHLGRMTSKTKWFAGFKDLMEAKRIEALSVNAYEEKT